MTAGSVVTNLLLYLQLLPLLRAETPAQDAQQLTPSLLYGFLTFRIIEWAVMVHVLTRLGVTLTRKYGLRGGFAHLRSPWKPGRSALRGALVGVAAAGIATAMAHLWFIIGVFDRPIWVELMQSGATWQAAFVGGIRNLFAEEVATRVGVQTLLLYHLRRFRWAPWVAIVLSSLFFEVWHGGGSDFYLMKFAASLLFAWVYTRDGYEAAAVGHCVADWLGLALPILLLS